MLDLSSDGEEETRVVSLVVPPSLERVMIRSAHDAAMAESSGESAVIHDLVWPHPSEPGKARFVLHDQEEVGLWHLLGERGLLTGSELAVMEAKLKESREMV